MPAEHTSNKARVLQGSPVKVLTGNEAPYGYPLLREWAVQLFKLQGGVASRPEIGAVVLDKRSVIDSMAHGMNPAKAVAFAAVKEVVEQGVIVLQTRPSRDGHSFYISAPVRIAQIDNIVTVLVRRDPNIQRMYLHSVIAKKNLLKTRYSGTDTASGVERSGKATSGDIATILRHLLQVKLEAEVDAATCSRLRWRCRRGMRELDQLLERWLRQRWAASSDAERGVFLRLLDSEDDRLWAWFMGHEEPPDAGLAALIHTIGQLPP